MTCSLLILPVISMLSLQAQDYLISFTGSGASTTVVTVKVENLTKGTSLTMNGSNVLHLMGVVTGIETVKDDEAGRISFYPNPMKDYLRMQFVLPDPGETLITLYDLSGRRIVQTQNLLLKGQHTYRIQGVEEGIYFVKIISGRYSYSGRFISSGSQNRKAKIVYENIENTMVKPEKQSDSKGTNEETVMQYTTGERLKLTGISGNYSTVMTDVPASSKSITFNFIACIDGDGNNYPVVKIGTQTWMAENLKTTKYNVGTDIPLVTDNTIWSSLITHGYCWFNNNATNYKDTYGALYNYYPVKSGNLCPIGWHVPTDTEWHQLILLMDPLAQFYTSGIESEIAGGKLKETGTNHWSSISTGASNESGFTVLPGSQRMWSGSFGTLGEYGFWWSSTEQGERGSWGRNIYKSFDAIQRYVYTWEVGFSVRCLKDN